MIVGRELHSSRCYIFWQLWTPGTSVRLLGVGITGLNPKQQLNLWDDANDQVDPETPANPIPAESPVQPAAEESEKQQKIQEVIEALQKQYGKSLVQRGAKG